MNVTILLFTKNSEQSIASFFQSLLRQSSEIHELIIVDEESNDSTIVLANEIKEKAPFPVQIITLDTSRSISRYGDCLLKSTGDIVLFASPDEPFLPNKVKEYKRYIEEDPFLYFVFHNAEVTNADGDVILRDYFGKTGFYESWDYYKPLSKLLLTGHSFLHYSQIGINRKFVDKLNRFFETFPTYETSLSLPQFLTVFAAIYYQAKEMKEIPYVLSQISEYSFPTAEEQTAFLQECIHLYQLHNEEKTKINRLQRAYDFHRKRMEKPSLFSRIVRLPQYMKHLPFPLKTMWEDGK